MNATFEQAREHFLRGLAHLQGGRAAEAETDLLASLALVPGRTSTLLNLAVARMALGRPAQAVEHLNLVLQTEPDNVMAWSHLGEARQALGQAREALAAFDEAWKRGPATAALRYHRAQALAAAAQAQAAWDVLQPLLDAADPAAALAWQLAGQILQLLDRHDAAVSHYEQALRLNAALSRCWLLLGQVHQRQQRPAEARQALQQALSLGEDSELVRYLLAALGPEVQQQQTAGKEPEPPSGVPAISPVAYVRGLFDPYAEGFDEHLVNALRYRGHSAVANAALQDPRPLWTSTLDLGCGTGLCGALLRGRSGRLVGVDLSPTMVELARRRGCFDTVHTADVVQHLMVTEERHDLVLSADVFIYIGDLRPVLAGVQRVLKPGGRFVFSIELDEAADDALGFCLRPSLRYAHAPAGIARRAEAAGLAVESVDHFVLREEEGEPIAGAVMVLRHQG